MWPYSEIRRSSIIAASDFGLGQRAAAVPHPGLDGGCHPGTGPRSHGTLDLRPWELQATLLNLSPWQAWVHLYRQKAHPAPDAAPVAQCSLTFECNGMDGEPVTWAVDVAPQTIFSYWPVPDGSAANLQTSLMETGKTKTGARRWAAA